MIYSTYIYIHIIMNIHNLMDIWDIYNGLLIMGQNNNGITNGDMINDGCI